MKKILIILFVAALAFVSFVALSLLTTKGGQFVAKKALERYAHDSDVEIGGSAGNFAEGMTLENLEIKDIKDLPEGTTLKIQRIFVNVDSLSLDGVYVELENVRLKLPNSDPIVLFGTFKDQQLNLNIYSRGFTVTEVLSYLPDLKKLLPVKGEARDIDLYVTGPYLEPKVTGGFIVKKFLYEGFLLTDAPLKLDIQLKDIKKDIKLFGSIHLEEGELQTSKVLVKLGMGQLVFSGPWNQPRINLTGKAKVEKTNINISLKGTIENPDLTLTSEPPFSQQKLMIMLATGKSWQSIDELEGGGLNSQALTKDFIDYFFFSGDVNRFAKRFGISDFSVTLDQNHMGIAAKAELSDNLEVGYGVEQSTNEEQAKDVTQKVESSYKMSEELSVGVEREIKKTQSSDALNDPTIINDDKVLLKYKRSF